MDAFFRSKSLAKTFMSYLDSYLPFILKNPESVGTLHTCVVFVVCLFIRFVYLFTCLFVCYFRDSEMRPLWSC